MELRVSNEGLLRFPIYVEVATVEANLSVASRERLIKVSRSNGHFIVEIDRRGESHRNIALTQIEERGLLIWVNYLTPDKLLWRTRHEPHGPPYYQIRGLIIDHID